MTLLMPVFSRQVTAADGLEGNLFSKITMAETLANTSAATSNRNPKTKLLGPTSLSTWLAGQDIDCRIDGQVVSVKAAALLAGRRDNLSSAATPLKLFIDPDAGVLQIELPFAKGDSRMNSNPSQLIDSLQKSSIGQGVHLRVNRASIALVTCMGNHRVDLDSLRAATARLVAASEQLRAAVDKNGSNVVAANRSEAVAEKTKTSVRAASIDSQDAIDSQATIDAPQRILKGTWSTKTSAGDAWAIRFADDQQFVMVHTRDGNNSISRGTFASEGKRLSLKDTAGLTLSGDVAVVNATTVRWTLRGGDGKPKLTLKLNKKP